MDLFVDSEPKLVRKVTHRERLGLLTDFRNTNRIIATGGNHLNKCCRQQNLKAQGSMERLEQPPGALRSSASLRNLGGRMKTEKVSLMCGGKYIRSCYIDP